MKHDTSAAVELRTLTKIYYNDDSVAIKAVDNLNLAVPCGHLFGLLGDKGAGKTTLVKIMSGLSMPTSGHIFLNNRRLTSARPVTLEQVGIALDSIQNINPQHSIWENFSAYAHFKGWATEELQQRAASVLADLCLPSEALECVVGQLPYAEQRLVAFACLALVDPPLFIFDEPLTGLEPETAQIVKDWLAHLVDKQGKTVVIASETSELVEELCTEVAIIQQGHLTVQQPVAKLLKAVPLYQIRLKGHLADHWSEWFDNLTIAHTEAGETILTGFIIDQAALYGVLIKVRDLALPLLGVTQVEPSLAHIMQCLRHTEQCRC